MRQRQQQNKKHTAAAGAVALGITILIPVGVEWHQTTGAGNSRQAQGAETTAAENGWLSDSDASGSEMEKGIEWETETETETESETETDTWNERKIEAETEIQMEPENGCENGDIPGKENGAETEAESEIGSEERVESEAGSEGESESESASESDTESRDICETETVSETEKETELESETEAESETEIETESETTTEVESETEIETESETITEAESETENETEAETASATESETEVHQSEQSGQAELPEEIRKAWEQAEKNSQEEQKKDAQNESETKEQEPSGQQTAPETNAEQDGKTAQNTQPRDEQETQKSNKAQDTENGSANQQTTDEFAIRRGRHYEIEGDDNAWYRDEKDRLWVRQGTNLYLKVKTDSGTLSTDGTEQLSSLQKDGTFMFRLRKTDSSGRLLARSEQKKEPYYVDGEAPEATISVDGQREGQVVYAAGTASASIAIAPDGKSGLKSAAYALLPCDENGTVKGGMESASWKSCVNGEQVEIQEEGFFQLCVRTEDQVGNLEFSRSMVFCVDHTPPQIQIEGVGDHTANAGEVKLCITGTDAHYREGSLHVELTGVNEGNAPKIRTKEETEEGATVVFFDFPHQKSYDDVYQLSVEAEDCAGNRTEQSMEFSVNRFGSVYDLDSETRTQLAGYYLTRPIDVIFYETNIDYIGESEIYCRRDGTLQELRRETDYQVSMKGSAQSWKRYQYTVPADYFSQEGVYELLLSSSDRAENQSDTGIQKKRVSFVLDWTAPDCLITGIEKEKVYEADAVTASIVPRDNVGIRTMRIFRDSEPVSEQTGNVASQEAVKLTLGQTGDWQTIQVYLEDLAGNTFWSDEIPVFVGASSENTPVYQKIRPSAQEQELLNHEADGENGSAADSNPEDEETEETGTKDIRTDDTKHGEEAAGRTADTAKDGESEADGRLPSDSAAARASQAEGTEAVQDNNGAGRILEGIVLLAFGILMIVLTVIAFR